LNKPKYPFRTDLFGWCKKDVIAYLADSDETAAELESLKKQLGSLVEKNIELKTEIERYKAREDLVKTDRKLISETMITVRKTADEIISTARIDAEAILSEIEQSSADERSKLASIRNEITALRRFATAAIGNFERELAALVQCD